MKPPESPKPGQLHPEACALPGTAVGATGGKQGAFPE